MTPVRDSRGREPCLHRRGSKGLRLAGGFDPRYDHSSPAWVRLPIRAFLKNVLEIAVEKFFDPYEIHCIMLSTAPKKILKSALYASRRIKNQFPVLIVANVIKFKLRSV